MWYIHSYIKKLGLDLSVYMEIRHNRKREFLETLKSQPNNYIIKTLVKSDKKLKRLYSIEFSLNSERDCAFLGVDSEAINTVILIEKNSAWMSKYDGAGIEQIPDDLLLNFCKDKNLALDLLLIPDNGSEMAYETFGEEARYEGSNNPFLSKSHFLEQRSQTLDYEVNSWMESIDPRVVNAFGITKDDIRSVISPFYSDESYKEFLIGKRQIADDISDLISTNPLSQISPDYLQDELSIITNVSLSNIREGAWPKTIALSSPENVKRFLDYWSMHKVDFQKYFDLYQTGAVFLRINIEATAGTSKTLDTDLLISALEYFLQENIILRHNPEYHQIFWTDFRKNALELGRYNANWPQEMERAVTWNERAYVVRHIFYSFEKIAKAGMLVMEDAKTIAELIKEIHRANHFRVSQTTIRAIIKVIPNAT
jgi:hypothetical protein